MVSILSKLRPVNSLQRAHGYILALGAIAFLSTCIITGCDRDANPATAPAGSNATTQAGGSPRQAGGYMGPTIVSTVPAATMQLIQLGAVNDLVGVSKYDIPILPSGKENLPVVGDYDTLNYELLLKLKPSALVVQMTPSHLTPRLKQIIDDQHITLVNVKLDTLADLYATAQALGNAAQRPKIASDAVTALQQHLADIRRQWADGPQPKVVYMLATSPIMVVGRGTFMDEELAIAGAQNMGAASGEGYPTINRENLIALAPDVLLIAAPGEPPNQGAQDPRIIPWIDLPIPAARKNRIYLITDPNGELATLVIADQVRALARTIHEADPPAPPATGKAAP
jgi:iron complex transport system substrate-binding protein